MVQINTHTATTFSAMALEYVPVDALTAYKKSLRHHSKTKIERLAKFISKSGVITPLVIDGRNAVILGNARLEAIKALGMQTAPVIRVTHLDDTMIRALILADNQFTLNASWYKDALREELASLFEQLLFLEELYRPF